MPSRNLADVDQIQLPAGVAWLGQDEAGRLSRGHPALADSLRMIVIAFWDDSTVSAAERLLATVAQAHADRGEQLRLAVLDALAETLEPSTAAAIRSAEREAELRAAVIRKYNAFDSAEIGRRVGGSERNPYSTASRWRKAGRVFSVRVAGKQLYPAFQFDHQTSEPLPVVADLLRFLRRGDRSDWGIALWFARPNGWLDDAIPADLLLNTPDLVRQAAEHETAEDPGF